MTNQNVMEAAERYLSRQPHCESDEDGNPLYTRNQMLRAFWAGEIAIIDKPSPGDRTITGETARGEACDLSPLHIEPLFWYRPVGEDGGYEGPHHAASELGKMFRSQWPDQWKPLYPAPAHLAADVLRVTDGGNSITVHFSEIKSAKAFRDALPVAATPAPVSHVMGSDQLDEDTKQKLRAALRFSASRSVITAEDERRILAALSATEGNGE